MSDISAPYLKDQLFQKADPQNFDSQTPKNIGELLVGSELEYCNSVTKNEAYLSIDAKDVHFIKFKVPLKHKHSKKHHHKKTIDVEFDIVSGEAPVEQTVKKLISFIKEPKLIFNPESVVKPEDYIRSNYMFDSLKDARHYIRKLTNTKKNNTKSRVGAIVCNKEEINYSLARENSKTPGHKLKFLNAIAPNIHFHYKQNKVSISHKLRHHFHGQTLYVPLFKSTNSSINEGIKNNSLNGAAWADFNLFCSQLNTDVPMWDCDFRHKQSDNVTATVKESFTTHTNAEVKGSLAGNLMRSINDDIMQFQSQYSDFTDGQKQHVRLAEELEEEYERELKRNKEDLSTKIRKTYFEEYDMKRSNAIKNIVMMVMLMIGGPALIHIIQSKTPLGAIIPSFIFKTVIFLIVAVTVFMLIRLVRDFSQRSKFNFDDYDLRTHEESDGTGGGVGLSASVAGKDYIDLRLYTKENKDEILKQLEMLKKAKGVSKHRKPIKDKHTGNMKIDKQALNELLQDDTVKVEYSDSMMNKFL